MKTFSSLQELEAQRGMYRYIAFVTATSSWYGGNSFREACSFAYRMLRDNQRPDDYGKGWCVYQASDGLLVAVGFWSSYDNRFHRVHHIDGSYACWA